MKSFLKDEKAQISVGGLIIIAVLFFTFVALLPILTAAQSIASANMTDSTGLLLVAAIPIFILLAIVATLFIYVQVNRVG